MTIQEFINSATQFFYISAVYYVIQLVRCVLLSFAVFALIFVLRKTELKNRVFIKGALWSLLIPVLYAGKMKFFYENRMGVRLFSWLTDLCTDHVWICGMYLCGAFVYAVFLFRRRMKLKKLVASMEKREVDGTFIYVTELPVTPFTVGMFRPKIVMPEVILKEYGQKEYQMVLFHEKTHIRLGHLLFYFLWDILRVLLWLNPFFAIGIRYFREDMEEICDFVTIKQSEGKAYDYGQLLLKSMRVLQAESEDFNMYATFAGDNEYQSVRQRVKRIAQYKPYKKSMVECIKVFTVVCILGIIFCLHGLSYDRYYADNTITIFGMNDNDILVTDHEGKIISHDNEYIYIDMEALQQIFHKNGIQKQPLFVYCGGFYKIPGIGIGSGFGYVNEENYTGGTQKIPYENREDVWTMLLKII